MRILKDVSPTVAKGADCVCPFNYDPVCGKDGGQLITFGNACAAGCAGAEIAYPGQCADPAGCAAVSCPADYSPVCGADGVTYPNLCNAECTGVSIVSKGECSSGNSSNKPGGGEVSCSCPKIFDPVCGTDDKTYGNECLAKCDKAGVKHVGNCADPSGCAAVSCPTDYSPVCGADGVTYSNECNAGCTGITIVSKGECGSGSSGEEDRKGGKKDGDAEEPGCFCAEIYAPVCGADGNTYGNECEATCAKTEVSYVGKCADPSGCAAVLCPAVVKPVCGANNVTYPNDCQASCTGVSVVAEGPCPGDEVEQRGKEEVMEEEEAEGSGCPCPKNLAPVCGTDAKTYGNKCLAKCAKVAVLYEGNCANPAGCAAVTCPANYEPLCGADNITYSNQCNADCAGITIAYKGECGSRGAPDTTKASGSDDSGSTSCPCPKNLAPVCGKDGKTYANSCLAKCAKVAIAYQGRCEDPEGCATVRCITEYDPVCGANGKTYQNECFAACTGVSYKPGACKVPGGRKGSPSASRRPPPKKASPPPKRKPFPPPASSKVAASECTQCESLPLAPVCGVDGITYGSRCLASCSGVKVAAEKACD
ncbi:hypothetical protein GPECTOR_5g83 [Gonium pectorale]|uniref:Kazal-like domain-containing protein n=1 Tax=Gonium pectorale TaxID=33097 RepID=A0A150GYM8_GONPE|nr:hypothetical protein GPECTOR_5g83 [Gonium pectorale]|eukprot:KXZ54430.1 hypothetical protein GPECTOR_5g83 [Gonium pectorale]